MSILDYRAGEDPVLIVKATFGTVGLHFYHGLWGDRDQLVTKIVVLTPEMENDGDFERVTYTFESDIVYGPMISLDLILRKIAENIPLSYVTKEIRGRTYAYSPTDKHVHITLNWLKSGQHAHTFHLLKPMELKP